MTDYKKILDLIQADPRYQANLDWGKPRKGHPEATVRAHIEELIDNLHDLSALLTADEIARLRIAIHVHDTFKKDAKKGVQIIDNRSHASLASTFLGGFIDDLELRTLVQFHDEPYALWGKHVRGDRYTGRFGCLLDVITDWDLFLAFQIIDNCTKGKDREPTEWFFDAITPHVETRVSKDWIAAVSAS